VHNVQGKLIFIVDPSRAADIYITPRTVSAQLLKEGSLAWHVHIDAVYLSVATRRWGRFNYEM
jgi:hypothetical protein